MVGRAIQFNHFLVVVQFIYYYLLEKKICISGKTYLIMQDFLDCCIILGSILFYYSVYLHDKTTPYFVLKHPRGIYIILLILSIVISW